METPCSFSCRTFWKSRATSSSARAAVGSSRMRILGLASRARVISTLCRWARFSSATRRSGSS